VYHGNVVYSIRLDDHVHRMMDEMKMSTGRQRSEKLWRWWSGRRSIISWRRPASWG